MAAIGTPNSTMNGANPAIDWACDIATSSTAPKTAPARIARVPCPRSIVRPTHGDTNAQSKKPAVNDAVKCWAIQPVSARMWAASAGNR